MLVHPHFRGDDRSSREPGAAAVAPPDEDLRSLSTPALVALITDRHHNHLRASLPRMVALATEVASLLGERHPRLRELRDCLAALSGSLLAHIAHEEEVLFPALLARAASRGEPSVGPALAGIVDEHQATHAALVHVSELTDHYAPPDGAPPLQLRFYQELHALMVDVDDHLRLENDLLGPRLQHAAGAGAALSAGRAR
jgi:regulator of cell morphogenesis and NO signaling